MRLSSSKNTSGVGILARPPGVCGLGVNPPLVAIVVVNSGRSLRLELSILALGSVDTANSCLIRFDWLDSPRRPPSWSTSTSSTTRTRSDVASLFFRSFLPPPPTLPGESWWIVSLESFVMMNLACTCPSAEPLRFANPGEK